MGQTEGLSSIVSIAGENCGDFGYKAVFRDSSPQRHAASSAAVKGLQSICPNMQQLTPGLKTSAFTPTSPPTGFSGTTFCQVSPYIKSFTFLMMRVET